MTELKTKLTEASVDKFISMIDEEKKRDDCNAIIKLMARITKAEPKMWGTSIVGFGSYHYKYVSGQEADWPLVGFSPRKQNVTLYIMGGFEKYEELMSKLGKYKMGKVCIYIKSLNDIDVAVLEKLIKGSVEYVKSKYA